MKYYTLPYLARCFCVSDGFAMGNFAPKLVYLAPVLMHRAPPPPGDHKSKPPNHGQSSVHGEPKFNQWTTMLCTPVLRKIVFS